MVDPRLNRIADADWLYVFQIIITQIFIICRSAPSGVKGEEKGWGGGPGRSLQGLIDLKALQAQGFPLWVWGVTAKRLYFVLLWREFWVPPWVGQAVTNHGTFCSVSLDDLHMCSWTIIQKPPGESRSLGPLGKLLGIYVLQHFSMFPFPLLPHHWQRLPLFLMLWLKAGTRKQGADSLWNCLPSTS